MTTEIIGRKTNRGCYDYRAHGGEGACALTTVITVGDGAR